jgi:hypothetical protein
MSRYYLHYRDFKGEMLEDDEGSEFSSLTDAVEEAMVSVHELVAHAIKGGKEPRFEAVVVADERGTQLAAVPLLAGLPSTIVNLLKQPEKVVSTDRLEEYRRNADECRTKAENAVDPDDKMSWLKLGAAWLQMLPATQSPSGDLAGWPKASDDDSKASH